MKLLFKAVVAALEPAWCNVVPRLTTVNKNAVV